MINQNDNFSTLPESSINAGTIQLMTRLFVILVGLGITLFGIKYTFDVFLLIYHCLQKPEALIAIIESWSVVLNIKGLILYDYPMDKLFVVIILAIGALLLLRITLGFIQAGTKILINSVNGGNVSNSSDSANEKAVVNLDYKLKKLKSLADQGMISKQAYENARDKYLVQKIMGN